MITPLDGVINIQTWIKIHTSLLFFSGLDPTKHEFPIYKLKPRTMHHRKITPQL